MVLLDLLHIQRAGFFKFLKSGLNEELSQLNINIENTRLEVLPFTSSPFPQRGQPMPSPKVTGTKQRYFYNKNIGHAREITFDSGSATLCVPPTLPPSGVQVQMITEGDRIYKESEAKTKACFCLIAPKYTPREAILYQKSWSCKLVVKVLLTTPGLEQPIEESKILLASLPEESKILEEENKLKHTSFSPVSTPSLSQRIFEENKAKTCLPPTLPPKGVQVRTPSAAGKQGGKGIEDKTPLPVPRRGTPHVPFSSLHRYPKKVKGYKHRSKEEESKILEEALSKLALSLKVKGVESKIIGEVKGKQSPVPLLSPKAVHRYPHALRTPYGSKQKGTTLPSVQGDRESKAFSSKTFGVRGKQRDTELCFPFIENKEIPLVQRGQPMHLLYPHVSVHALTFAEGDHSVRTPFFTPFGGTGTGKQRIFEENIGVKEESKIIRTRTSEGGKVGGKQGSKEEESKILEEVFEENALLSLSPSVITRTPEGGKERGNEGSTHGVPLRGTGKGVTEGEGEKSKILLAPFSKSNKRQNGHELFLVLGELPLMTKRGHFIINGSPRVILSQLVRTPGIYFTQRDNELQADCVPEQGPWLCVSKNSRPPQVLSSISLPSPQPFTEGDGIPLRESSIPLKAKLRESSILLNKGVQSKVTGVPVHALTFAEGDHPISQRGKEGVKEESRIVLQESKEEESKILAEVIKENALLPLSPSVMAKGQKEHRGNGYERAGKTKDGTHKESGEKKASESKAFSLKTSALLQRNTTFDSSKDLSSYFCYTKQFSSMPFSLIYSNFRIFELHSQFTDQTLLLTKLKTLEKIRQLRELITTLLTFTWKKRTRKRLQKLYTKRCFTATQQFEKTKIIFRLKRKLILGFLGRKSFNEKLGISNCENAAFALSFLPSVSLHQYPSPKAKGVRTGYAYVPLSPSESEAKITLSPSESEAKITPYALSLTKSITPYGDKQSIFERSEENTLPSVQGDRESEAKHLFAYPKDVGKQSSKFAYVPLPQRGTPFTPSFTSVGGTYGHRGKKDVAFGESDVRVNVLEENGHKGTEYRYKEGQIKILPSEIEDKTSLRTPFFTPFGGTGTGTGKQRIFEENKYKTGKQRYFCKKNMPASLLASHSEGGGETTLLSQDLALIIRFLDSYKIMPKDDIDDLNNQRVRTPSDQVQQQVRVGCLRFRKMFIKLVRESWGVSQTITDLLNGALREFFGSNPLSQFLDQTNSLAEITHKRRISKLGLGGIQRESATLKVRTIHSTYFGRICPIETPEGVNAGLVNSLTCLSRVNEQGQLVTPLSPLMEKQLQNQFFYYSNQEKQPLSTTDTALLKFQRLPNQFIYTKNESHFQQLEVQKVPLRVQSDLQTISLATALIPFLPYDDANRALMGSNMQRQAVPLILPERPMIRTGLESLVIGESGHSKESPTGGFVSYVSAQFVIIICHILNKRVLSS